VLELAGLRDILSKSLGSTNPVNLVAATVDGLQRLRRPEEVGRLRGKTVAEVLGVSPRANGDGGAPEAAADAPEPVTLETVLEDAPAEEVSEPAAAAAPVEGAEGAETP